MVDTTVAPYFDDFDEDKGFIRVLFRPGRAVQARELTQLQTILQNQIKRFGENIFQDGAMVIPGGASIDTNYEFVKIQNNEFGGVVAGATVVGNNSGVVARIIQLVPLEGSDPATLYIRYTDGGSLGGGRFINGETLTWTNPVDQGGASGTFTAASASATGKGTKIDLNKGIYFIRGVFAAAVSQSLIIEKYGIPQGDMEVGLVVSESIVTADQDSSLNDNANGTNNFNAPGADRLKLVLNLIKKEDALNSAGETENDYFTIAKIKDGVIVEQLSRTAYAIIGDEMARRTYDESGDYTVDPFIVNPTEHPTDDTKLRFTIDSGRAYVKGYLVDKPLKTEIDINKSLTTEVRANSRTPTYFGNYIRINSIIGAPRIDTFALFNLRNTSNTTIGTARARAITLESGSIYRLYIFDVKMNAGSSFNQVNNISGGGIAATLIDDENNAVNNNALLYDTGRNTLLFRIPHSRIKSISDISVRVQRYITGTTNASGQITLDTNNANFTFAATSNWIIFNNTGAIVTPSASFTSAGSQTLTVSGLAADTAHTFITYIDKSAATTNARPKTLTTVTEAVRTPDGSGNVTLAHADIFRLVSVLDADNADADITARYRLDNGQRDNFYDLGRLVLRSGSAAPTGNVKVSYTYFQHGSGHYFNVSSYNSLVNNANYSYADIPSHTFSDGRTVRLSEYYDFRPRINDAGDNFTGAGQIRNELPKHNETILEDVEYFLPRNDLLTVSEDGDFRVIEGNPALEPRAPAVPSNSMAIYRILLGPGTLSAQDIRLDFIENRRYTMRDIGNIEKRIEKVELWSTLSALETSTSTLEVLDAAGNNRFKSGFFVDNFKNHVFSDFRSPEYRASLDPINGEIRPVFREYNATLRYTAADSSSNNSANVVRRGDQLMLSYTEEPIVVQPLASSTINVNPYSVITNIGILNISPESDEWRDVETETIPVIVQPTPVVNPRQENNWDNWRWNWAGTGIVNPIQNDVIDVWAPDPGGAGGRIWDNFQNPLNPIFF